MAQPIATVSSTPLRWDVFCRVVDNFGDIGVCWRLCADLGARGHAVRLWVDDNTPLHWMAPGALEGSWPGVQVLDWGCSQNAALLASLAPADVWVEGFGCEIATEFIAARADSTRATGQNDHDTPVWVNLEYLSAERYVERSHGLASPVMRGPAKGWTKFFFYPGFSGRTGGLLREPDLLQRQQAFAQGDGRADWLARHGITWAGEQLVSLFCYEPGALAALLEQLDAAPTPTLLLVSAGRASKAVEAALAQRAAESAEAADQAFQRLRVAYLPPLTQADFDQLLWGCDLNFVRGEDSLVRALWAGKPLVWQIYPQDDAAHVDKLNAFLDAIGAPASLRSFHHVWNGTHPFASHDALPLIDLNSWSHSLLVARERLLQMDDLVTQLVQFVLKKR
jgi:uncharacterized repeat protein (TIGR03837 family)